MTSTYRRGFLVLYNVIVEAFFARFSPEKTMLFHAKMDRHESH